jgi:hypothetical protein
MSKTKELASNFLAKNVPSQINPGKNESANAAKNLFNFVELDRDEEIAIDTLLLENSESIGTGDLENDIVDDARKLKDITRSIKGIDKASVYLTGKQINEARELLKNHNKSGNSFGQWLQIAFKGSKSTAYNALAYYGFFDLLPNEDLKKRFKEIPQRAAYLLASRNGDIERKIKFLEETQPKGAAEIIERVDELLPLPSKDRRKRKANNEEIIKAIRAGLKKLAQCKEGIDSDTRKELEGIRSKIDEILASECRSIVVENPEQLQMSFVYLEEDLP